MSPSTDDPDAQAMSRLQRGEELALNEMMTRWQLPLTRFLARYTGQEADALDLAQETFVRIYENRARYRPATRFSTWLFAIALNLARNQARWKARHPAVSFHDLSPSLQWPENRPDPAAQAEQTEKALAVRQAILALPDELRAALIFFQYEDKSYDEIAALLGCNGKAVENRLYRARQLLRERLTAWL